MMMFYLVFSCFIYSCFRRAKVVDFQGFELPNYDKKRVDYDKKRVNYDKKRVNYDKKRVNYDKLDPTP